MTTLSGATKGQTLTGTGNPLVTYTVLTLEDSGLKARCAILSEEKDTIMAVSLLIYEEESALSG